MSMSIRARSRLVLALVTLLAFPAIQAQASTYSNVLRSYQKHGSIPACQFSSQQLASALKSVDTYGAQYFADFTTAIQSALAARASGACSSASALAGAASSAQSAASGGPVPQIAVTGASDASLPAPIVLMAALAALLTLLGVTFLLATVRGWDPAWAAGWRHAWSEAGYRVGGTWSEFADWLRSGR